jgi:hypothetical protein
VRINPSDDGDICDGESVTDEEPGGGLFEVGVKDAVEAAGFVGVTVHTILDVLRGVSYESSLEHAHMDSTTLNFYDSLLKWLACLCLELVL